MTAAALAGTPQFESRLKNLTTSQRTCEFYMSWFGRCFRNGETGWFAFQTPDGESIMLQDAFFWNALEVIARELNAQIALQRAKMMQQNT